MMESKSIKTEDSWNGMIKEEPGVDIDEYGSTSSDISGSVKEKTTWKSQIQLKRKTSEEVQCGIPSKKERLNSRSKSMNSDELYLEEKVWSFFKEYNLEFLIPEISDLKDLSALVLEHATEDRLKVFLKNLSLGRECLFLKSLKNWRSKLVLNTLGKSITFSNGLRFSKINLHECFGTPFGGLLKTKLNFTIDDRVIVSTKIGEYLVNNLLKPTPNMFVEMLRQIVQIFPHEKGSEALYYKKDERNKPSGLLYIKYAKAARNNRSILNLQNGGGSDSVEKDEDEESSCIEDENINSSIQWLEEHKNPSQDSFSELKDFWELTSSKRNPKSNDLENWPQFKLSIGYDLISIDFKYYNKNASELSRNDALEFLDKMLPKMKNLINSQTYKKKCEEMVIIENEDDKFCELFRLMHAMFPPTQRRTYIGDSKKKFCKPSIEQSMLGFVQDVPTLDDIGKKLAEIEEEYSKIGVALKPKIFKIKNYVDGKYAVVYKDYNFGFNDILPAIDCCFKMFSIFNTDYPFRAMRFWKFIAHFFYNIDVDDRDVIAVTKELRHLCRNLL